MALLIKCCLNPSPSPNPAASTRTIPTPPWLTSKDQNEGRRKFIGTMACVVISCTAGTIVNQELASAAELIIIRPTETSRAKLVRWSDKRMCPPWQENSLESIVPENLPRPFASRRPNRVVTQGSETAEIGSGVSIRFDKRCFSL